VGRAGTKARADPALAPGVAALKEKIVAAAEPTIDPIHQFNLSRYVDLHIGNLDLSFTNAALFMFVVAGAVCWLMIYGTSGQSLVPGRLQAAAEIVYEFVASTVTSTVGPEGMQFFPFVFSLFMFVLFSNLIGLIPYAFTVTSQIIVTGALAILVISLVIFYGLYKHGPHFLGLFVPSGVTPLLLPFLVVIEVISFLSRPISLSVRLFANMLAGHITLKVFGGFVATLLAAGGWAMLAPLPLAGTIVLTAFELLVATLQAYVFAILTCVYLNDALHPGH
jgi:F-type H+-transporting ATPase subunit a